MRIIPALAGNTIGCLCNVQPAKDHPRSRGEYVPVSEECGLGLGSSPLSRGIPLRPPPRAGGAGIIPALAGNTNLPCCCGSSRPDHPRSRGEYLTVNPERQEVLGSSPLSRGIRSIRLDRAGPMRIIPALAGNTSRCSMEIPRRRDHPRSRGEYRAAARPGPGAAGSSPLSRGILIWRGIAYP